MRILAIIALVLAIHLPIAAQDFDDSPKIRTALLMGGGVFCAAFVNLIVAVAR